MRKGEGLSIAQRAQRRGHGAERAEGRKRVSGVRFRVSVKREQKAEGGEFGIRIAECGMRKGKGKAEE